MAEDIWESNNMSSPMSDSKLNIKIIALLKKWILTHDSAGDFRLTLATVFQYSSKVTEVYQSAVLNPVWVSWVPFSVWLSCPVSLFLLCPCSFWSDFPVFFYLTLHMFCLFWLWPVSWTCLFAACPYLCLNLDLLSIFSVFYSIKFCSSKQFF